MSLTTLSPVINPLQQWQSLPMIPVVLQLLKEYYEGQISKKGYSGVLGYEIQTYEKIFHHWENLEGLNPIQKQWLTQIGDYIQALQNNHTLFSPVEKRFCEDNMLKSDCENSPRYSPF